MYTLILTIIHVYTNIIMIILLLVPVTDYYPWAGPWPGPGPGPAPCAGAAGPPVRGDGGPSAGGPSERAQHMGRGAPWIMIT